MPQPIRDYIKHSLSEKKGITLIEILMVTAIFGILLVAIQAMFVAGMDVFNREQSQSEERRQLYFAAEQIIKHIRNTPINNILLSGSSNGVYDRITLTAKNGVKTDFYLEGNSLYRESDGIKRLIAEKIAVLRFEVICNVLTGTYDSFNPVTLKITDSDRAFNGHDPEIKGMIARFENFIGEEKRYIYRRIVDHGTDWFTLDAGFVVDFQPSVQKYAVGKTFQIYLRNRTDVNSIRGTEVITGVTPRF